MGTSFWTRRYCVGCCSSPLTRSQQPSASERMVTLDDSATPKAVRSGVVQSYQSKVPRTQPTIRSRKYNAMSPKVTSNASDLPSGPSTTSNRVIIGGMNLVEPGDDPGEITRHSIDAGNSLTNRLVNTLETTVSGASTTSSTPEFTLDGASGTSRERASSVSSVESFTTSYEPSEVTAAKLKITAKELRDAEHSSGIAQGRVNELERKLHDVTSAKTKAEEAHVEETAKLRATVADLTASHDKLADEFKGEILQLRVELKEATEHLATQKLILSGRNAALEAQLNASTAAQSKDAKEHEGMTGALRARIETAEVAFTKEKAELLQQIKTLKVELQEINAAATGERKAQAKEILAIAAELQAAVQLKDELFQSSARVAKNNDRHLENIQCLEKKLKEAEEISSSTSIKLSESEKENANLSEEHGKIQRQLEQTLEDLDVFRNEVGIMKQSSPSNGSEDLKMLLDQLREITSSGNCHSSGAGADYLHSRVQALENARVIEVAATSHLFDENTFLRALVSSLQADIEGAKKSRAAAELLELDDQAGKSAILKENAVLTAQFNELRSFLDFAQRLILTVEQQKIVDDAFIQANTDSGRHDETKLQDQAESSEEICKEDSVLLSENTTIRDLLEKEQESRKLCQNALNRSEATLRQVQTALNDEKSAHEICKEKLDTTKEKYDAMSTRTDTSTKRLQLALETEKADHQACKTNLARVEQNLRLLAITNQSSTEKVAQLEAQVVLQAPLFRIGLLSRQVWWEQARSQKFPNRVWRPYRNRGNCNKNLVRKLKAKIQQPNAAADTSLFLQGALTEAEDRHMFESIYRQKVPHDLHRVTNPVLLAEVNNMRATLRDRIRLSAYAHDGSFNDSDEYEELERDCKLMFQRMMAESNLNRNSDGPERRAVEDAFDMDPEVQAKVNRMTQIFNREMKYFRNTTRND